MRRFWTSNNPYLTLLPCLQQDSGGGSGSAGGDADSGDDKGDGGHKQPGDTGDSSSRGKDDEDDPSPPAVSFRTEADFMKRLRQGARSQLDEDAKKAGFESHQAMLDAAKASKAEEDKKLDEAAREKRRADEAEEKAKNAMSQANERLIHAEVKLLAGQEDIRLEPKAVDDAYRLMSREDVEVDAEGNVTGVAEALKQLVGEKPWMQLAEEKPKPTPKTPGRKDDENQSNVAMSYLSRVYSNRSGKDD